MANSKKDAARKLLEGLQNGSSHAFVIHYSRQNLSDNEDGRATPRIVAIMMKSIDGRETHCFAIHHEAEKAKIISEEIENYYDMLEERLLKAFNAFVGQNRNCLWLHWDMNDVHFGFEAIKHRYMVLCESTDEFNDIPTHNRININELLKDIFGSKYEKEPRLENLMKTNNDGGVMDGFLNVSDEAKEFKKLGFPTILESLRCKVNFLLDVIDKAYNDTLKVSSKFWTNKLKAFITHPVTATTSLLLTLISIVLKLMGVFSGG
jgi:hypothetical protein